MQVRRFTQEGLREFAVFASEARRSNKAKQAVPPVSPELLEHPTHTQPTSYSLPLVPEHFEDKMALGKFAVSVLPAHVSPEVEYDVGMWSWLAARLFDQITKGRTKIKEERGYVLGLSFQEFYRHLIFGPYFIYKTAQEDPDRVRVLLYDEPTTMNEVMVQFGSYQTLMQNPGLQRVIQALYFDSDSGRTRRGAGGKGAGTPRRLMDFFRQIEINYDLRHIRDRDIWALLPREFDRFKIAEPDFA